MLAADVEDGDNVGKTARFASLITNNGTEQDRVKYPASCCVVCVLRCPAVGGIRICMGLWSHFQKTSQQVAYFLSKTITDTQPVNLYTVPVQ